LGLAPISALSLIGVSEVGSAITTGLMAVPVTATITVQNIESIKILAHWVASYVTVILKGVGSVEGSQVTLKDTSSKPALKSGGSKVTLKGDGTQATLKGKRDGKSVNLD